MPAKMKLKLPDEFTSTMQQLVAEAEKTIPASSEDIADGLPGSNGSMAEFATLNERVAGLERLLSSGFDGLAKAQSRDDGELVSQMQRMDEHMVALRNTESVNQRLFNSLHDELRDYRDNFLRESLQKPFIRDLVVLFDDLSTLAAQMDTADGAAEAKRGTISHWRSNLENAIHSLVEVLHRMEVTEIEPKEMVDRALHRVVSYEPADFAEEDGQIMMRIKRGFVWRDQVLRPEEVVAKRFN